jgi:hypothetical protein
MLSALKKTVETVAADLRELGPLPMPIAVDIKRIEWAMMVRSVGVLWDCVLELDSLAGVAGVQGYPGIAERYRRASRNLKPAIVNYEGSR